MTGHGVPANSQEMILDGAKASLANGDTDMTLFLIILSTIVVSLISLLGVLTLSLKEKILDKMLFYLVALSIGAMMGGAFLHLIPEAVEKAEGREDVFLYVLGGFFLFLLIERVLHWRHCHEGHCPVHTFAHMSLIGDGVHNFIDGLIIAGSYLVDAKLGVASTLAIILHEIPQEIGDFGVLLFAGFKKKTALYFNFISAALALAGGLAGYFFFSLTGSFTALLLPIAAGGFIYISASDLLPEIRKEMNLNKSIYSFLLILAGFLMMYLMKFMGAE